MAEVISEIASFDIDTQKAVTQVNAYIARLDALQKEQKQLQAAGKDTARVNEEIAKTTAVLNRALTQETQTLKGATAQTEAMTKATRAANAELGKSKEAVITADRNVTRLAKNFATAGGSVKNLGGALALGAGGLANFLGVAELSGVALGVLSSLAGSVVESLFGLSEAEKAVQEATKGAVSAYVEENKQLTDNFTALLNANEGSKERADLIENINKQYGQYLPALLTEKSSLFDIAQAYEAVNRGIVQKIVNQARQTAITERTNALIQQQVEQERALIERYGELPSTLETIDRRRQRTAAAIKTESEAIAKSIKGLEDALLGVGLGADEFYSGLEARAAKDISQFGLRLFGKDAEALAKSQEKATGATKNQRKESEALAGSLAELEKQLSTINKQINEQTRIGDSEKLQKLGTQYAEIAAKIDIAKKEIERFKRGLQDVQEVTALPDLPPVELPVTFATTAETGAEIASQIEEALAKERIPILNAALNAAEIAQISAESADAQVAADRKVLALKIEILETQRAIAIAEGESVAEIDKQLATLRAQRIAIDTSQADAALKRTKDLTQEIASGVEQLAGAVFDFLAQSAAQSVARFDSAVQKQQSSLDALLADQQNASVEQVRIEQERLDKLTAQREKAKEREAVILRAQIAANAALAIAKAAAEGGGIASAITIAATLASLAFGFIAARQQSEQAFFEGTEYVKRGKGEPVGRDTVKARLNEGEAVIPTETNKQYRAAVSAIYNKTIPAKELNEFVKNREKYAELAVLPLPIRAHSGQKTDRQAHRFLKQIAANTGIRESINITESGITKLVTNRQARANKLDKKYR